MFPRVGWAETESQCMVGKNNRYFLAGHCQTWEKKRCRRSVQYVSCATSSTVFPVDEEGMPLRNALMWMDARSKKKIDAVNRNPGIRF